MDIFDLPHSTIVNRFVPKKSFYSYTNTKQKETFTTLIEKLTWRYKLSPESVHLNAGYINEIQVFQIILKAKKHIPTLLEIIDKAIPYTIIFIIQFHEDFYLSTSVKHPHPTKGNNTVIDWTFTSQWFSRDKHELKISLRGNLDTVYHGFCAQLSGINNLRTESIQQLVTIAKKMDTLKKERNRLKASIGRSRQFNKKVELNLKLEKVERKLEQFL